MPPRRSPRRGFSFLGGHLLFGPRGLPSAQITKTPVVALVDLQGVGKLHPVIPYPAPDTHVADVADADAGLVAVQKYVIVRAGRCNLWRLGIALSLHLCLRENPCCRVMEASNILSAVRLMEIGASFYRIKIHSLYCRPCAGLNAAAYAARMEYSL